MSGGNIRPAPAFFTADLVRRVLEQIEKPVVIDKGGIPVVKIPTRGVKPQLEIVPVELDSNVAELDAPAFLPRPSRTPDWTREEDDRLRLAYAKGERIDLVAEELGRTEKAAYSRATKIGLSHPRDIKGGFITNPKWSDAEDDLLRSLFGNIPTSQLPERIGRSKTAIFNRAHALGLVHGYHRQFTRDELKALQIGFDRGLSIADLAAAMGRKAFSLSKYASNHGYAFGRRPLLAQPVTLAAILDLEDSSVPLPPTRSSPRKGRKLSEAALARRAAANETKNAVDAPLYQIAYDRGVAMSDLARALGKPNQTVSNKAIRMGLRFGDRQPLDVPLTREQLLALADPSVPLPELRRDRVKRLALAKKAKNERDRRARMRAEKGLPPFKAKRRRTTIVSAAATKSTCEVTPATVCRPVDKAPPREPTPVSLAASAQPIQPRPPAARARPRSIFEYAQQIDAAKAYLKSRGFTVQRHNRDELIASWHVSGWQGLFTNEQLVSLAEHYGMGAAA